MWTSFKQKLKRWRRGQASTNTANRREKGTKAHVIGKWYCPRSRANHLPVASRPIQPESDDKSHNLGLVYWSDEGKEANLFNLLPSVILFEEILARMVTDDEGPRNLCRLSCVCKFFYDASNDADTLKKVKISFFKCVYFKPISYQTFVSKCATVGNMRAIAAVKDLGDFSMIVDGEKYFLNERRYASYFLGMILYECPSTREEARHCFSSRGQSPDSEPLIYFRRNARRYLLNFGINQPLKYVEISCDIERCACNKVKAGYGTVDQFKHYDWIGYSCSFRHHYELFRVASVGAFKSD